MTRYSDFSPQGRRSRLAGRLTFAASVVAAVAVVGLPAAAGDGAAGAVARTPPPATPPAAATPAPATPAPPAPSGTPTPVTPAPPTASAVPTPSATPDAGAAAPTADRQSMASGLPGRQPDAAAATAATRVGVLAQPAQCPTSAAATFEVADSAVIGGTLRLQGTGWCHPTDGGSVIAVKIDDGAYSHLTGQGPNANLTVWQVVEAGDDGSFDVGIRLPTASNSTPEFTPGSYTLRLLTGSLKAGDNIRAVETGSFTVTAAASPGGSPTPGSSPGPGGDDELPTTGIDAYHAGLLGGLFILAGCVALISTRRSSTTGRRAVA